MSQTMLLVSMIVPTLVLGAIALAAVRLWSRAEKDAQYWKDKYYNEH